MTDAAQLAMYRCDPPTLHAPYVGAFAHHECQRSATGRAELRQRTRKYPRSPFRRRVLAWRLGLFLALFTRVGLLLGPPCLWRCSTSACVNAARSRWTCTSPMCATSRRDVPSYRAVRFLLRRFLLGCFLLGRYLHTRRLVYRPASIQPGCPSRHYGHDQS